MNVRSPVIAAAIFVLLSAPAHVALAARSQEVSPPSQSTCDLSDNNDIEYLIFGSPLPGNYLPDVNGINGLAAKLGTTGDGKTRQLGVADGIPVWVSDDAKIVQRIKMRFEMTKQTNGAVHFNIDDHIGLDERPDLWNWYDPEKRDTTRTIKNTDFNRCMTRSQSTGIRSGEVSRRTMPLSSIQTRPIGKHILRGPTTAAQGLSKLMSEHPIRRSWQVSSMALPATKPSPRTESF